MQARMKILTLVLVMVWLTLLGTSSAAAQNAKHLVVDDDGPASVECPKAQYTSIQAAVTAAPPNATIRVCPGIYNETVNVNKTLTILGAQSNKHAETRATSPQEESIVTGAGVNAFQLRANDIVLDGFTVEGTTGLLGGIFTDPLFSGYEIRDNIIRNNRRGLYVNSNGLRLTQVEHNLFDLNRFVSGPFFTGNALFSELGLANARIEENRFTANDIAILLDGGRRNPTSQNRVIIRKNEHVGDGNALQMFFTTDSEYTDNLVTNSRGTALIIGSGVNGLIVMGNTVRDNAGNGIQVINNLFVPINIPPTNVLVKVNLALNNNNGIALTDADQNTVRENRSESNRVNGINLNAGSDNNTIRENKCLRNNLDGIRVNSIGNNLLQNYMRDNLEHDAHDNQRPLNTWVNTNCITDFPTGTICQQGPADLTLKLFAVPSISTILETSEGDAAGIVPYGDGEASVLP